MSRFWSGVGARLCAVAQLSGLLLLPPACPLDAGPAAAARTPEKTGAALPVIMKRAVEKIAEAGILKPENTLSLNDVVLIENLEAWMHATGRLPLAPILRERDAFVFMAENGRPAPYFPIYLRRDSKFWQDMEFLDRRGKRAVAVAAMAAWILHEAMHAWGQERDEEAIRAELMILDRLRSTGDFKGPEAEEIYKNARGALETAMREGWKADPMTSTRVVSNK